MLTIADIRRQNLEALVTRFGSASALCAAAAARGVDISPVYVSQIRNQTPVRRKDKTLGPPRGMGDEQARSIEAGLGLELGWMDNIHRASDVLAQQLLDLTSSCRSRASTISWSARMNASAPSIPASRAPRTLSRALRRITTAVSSALSLVACAGLEERRAEPPSAIQFSPQPARAVATCIAARWEPELLSRSFEIPEMRPLENGWSVANMRRAQQQLGSFVDVKDTPAGSSSAVFLSRLDSAVIDLLAIVTACQQPRR